MSKNIFRSIFNQEKYRTRPNITTETSADVADWTISDCSLSSVDEIVPQRQKQHSQDLASKIQNCSDDEDDNNFDHTMTFLGGNTFNYCTSAKSARTQLSLSSRRRPLQVAIKRKSVDVPDGEAAHKVLTTRNSFVKKTLEHSAAMSPQCNKIRTALAAKQITTAECEPNETLIDWSNSSDSDTTCSSQRIKTQTTTSHVSNPPTELDMFLALIERECNAVKPPQNHLAKKTKKRRKGGYLQQLERSLESARGDRKFLEHDKKFGLQCGTQCRVVQLDAAFGVHMATLEVLSDVEHETKTVKAEEEEVDNSCVFLRVVLDATIAPIVIVGSKLEAFFDDKIAPYMCGGVVAIYVQPNKLLLL